MATKSFIDTYVIRKKDVDRFHNIMNNEKDIKIKKVLGHQDVKGNAILDMLGIKKK